MWFLIAVIVLGAIILALLLRAFNALRNGYKNKDVNRRKVAGSVLGAVLVVLLLLFLFALARDDKKPASADTPAGPLLAIEGTLKDGVANLKCPANDSDYKPKDTLNYGEKDPKAVRMPDPIGSGVLIGNGPPLDMSSELAAFNDLFGRTAENPLLTAQLAYILRITGYTPSSLSSSEKVEVNAEFIHQKAVQLAGDHALWAQARHRICELFSPSLQKGWKDRDLAVLASRLEPVTVNTVTLPVRTALRQWDPRPDGRDLLWVQRGTGSEAAAKFPVAIDALTAWPVMVGEVPEGTKTIMQEKPAAPSTSMQASTTQPAPSTSQQRSQQGTGGVPSVTTGGAPSGVTTGPTGTTGGGGGCGNACPGTTTGGGNGGNGGGGGVTPTTGPAPTTATPTTVAPPPTTKAPPPTTVAPPPTTRAPTPATTAPPSPTTTKKPDPGCNVPQFC